MPLSPDELRARARPWLEPISEKAPAGSQAKHEPAYEAVAQEVAKLESPTGGTVSWTEVVRQAGELLQHTTKDLWLAVWHAYGLYLTEGLPGAITGTAVLAGLTEQYWPTMFPDAKRPRGRVNALAWFVEHLARALPAAQEKGVDPEAASALAGAAKTLAATCRERLANQTPAFGPLLEAIERLRPSQPEAAPPTPAEPSASAPTPAPVSTPAPTSAPLGPLPPIPSGGLAEVGAAADYLFDVGTALHEAAAVVRRASSVDPLSYRVSRTGLWLHLERAPEPSANGRTPLSPLPASLRAQLERLESNSAWVELLEEAESVMVRHRLALDLQRYSAAALAGLGPPHAAAREALLREVGALLRRLPSLAGLLASDGSPLADARTRSWLQAEVSAAPTPPPSAAPAAPALQEETHPERETQALALLTEGKTQEALGLLQAAVFAAPTGRSRFIARLATARLCVRASQPALARALYEALDREVTALRLDEWEPALAATCLEGWLLTHPAVPHEGATSTSEFQERYQRLARLDPATLIRIGI